MIRLLIILTFISTSIYAQKYEQVAFNYFFHDIIEKEFPDLEEFKVKFSGNVEKKATTLESYLPACFSNEYELIVNINEAAKSMNLKEKSITLEKLPNSIKIYDREVKSKQRLIVYSATQVNNLYYVRIDIEKKKSGLSVYLIELDTDGKVLRWCSTGIIF